MVNQVDEMGPLSYMLPGNSIEGRRLLSLWYEKRLPWLNACLAQYRLFASSPLLSCKLKVAIVNY